MATRKKHIRTPYEDERKKHRAAASRHVLALEAQIKEDDKRKLFHIANDLRVYGNHLTNIAQKRVSQLFRTKAYREALKQYHNASSVLSSLDKGTPKYHEAKEKVKDAADVLERLQACQYACIHRVAFSRFPLWRVPKFCCLKRLGTCTYQSVRKVIV